MGGHQEAHHREVVKELKGASCALYSHLILRYVSFTRQEQCSVLVELMREYQTLKTSISSILESSEPLVEISSVLKDHEETRRSLTKVGSNSPPTSWILNCSAFLIIHQNASNFYCLLAICSTRQ